MIKKIFESDKNDITSFILRVVLALVILPHGLQKLIGAFGGYGFEGTMNYFTNTVGIPYALGVMVIVIESIGMIALALGFFTRGVALMLLLIMIGAASTLVQNGFFMNWFNNQPGEGVEFFILAIALCLHSVVKGGGKFAVDGVIGRQQP